MTPPERATASLDACPVGRRRVLGAMLGAAAPAVWSAQPVPTAAPLPVTPNGPVGPVGLPALSRGVNLSHWFEYERGQGVTLQELRGLAALGLDHVRIPVDPVAGGWNLSGPAPARFNVELRAALEMAIQAGLGVVLDLHLTPETKAAIEARPAAEASLEALWSDWGRRFADLPKTQLAFELFNEPQYYGWRAWRWPRLQSRLLAALRQHAPQHLVLMGGHSGGSLKGLQALAAQPQAAVAYVFHHYEPFMFTHQAAHWLDTRYTTAGLHRGIAYPAQAQGNVAPTLTKPHPRAAAEWQAHVKADWGPQALRREIDLAGAWARQQGIRLLCNEFGVIRAHVDPASRYRWLADMRAALEANQIGWTVWDYTDIFGLTQQSAQLQREGGRTLEPLALAALGLGAPITATAAPTAAAAAARLR